MCVYVCVCVDAYMPSYVAWSTEEEETKAGCDTALPRSSLSDSAKRAPPYGELPPQQRCAGKIPLPQIRKVQVRTGRSEITG